MINFTKHFPERKKQLPPAPTFFSFRGGAASDITDTTPPLTRRNISNTVHLNTSLTLIPLIISCLVTVQVQSLSNWRNRSISLRHFSRQYIRSFVIGSLRKAASRSRKVISWRLLRITPPCTTVKGRWLCSLPCSSSKSSSTTMHLTTQHCEYYQRTENISSLYQHLQFIRIGTYRFVAEIATTKRWYFVTLQLAPSFSLECALNCLIHILLHSWFMSCMLVCVDVSCHNLCFPFSTWEKVGVEIKDRILHMSISTFNTDKRGEL